MAAAASVQKGKWKERRITKENRSGVGLGEVGILKVICTNSPERKDSKTRQDVDWPRD